MIQLQLLLLLLFLPTVTVTVTVRIRHIKVPTGVTVIPTVIATTRATNETTIITTATAMQRKIHGAISIKDPQNLKRESQMLSKIIEKEGMG